MSLIYDSLRNKLRSCAIRKRAAAIKLIVSDVDGVLNDGSIFIGANGAELCGKFNALDGLAVTIANQAGIKLAIISGRLSAATMFRCEQLGIKLAFTGIADKLIKLQQIASSLNLDMQQIAYIGDDIIDLAAMQAVGLSCAPSSAVAIIKRQADYISCAGGTGVLRDVVELVVRR